MDGLTGQHERNRHSNPTHHTISPRQTQAGARVSLYNTPQLRGMLATLLRPPFNEVVGLQHTKLYVFDDITVLTG